MTLIEKLQKRYATKKFDSSKKVSEDKIQRILQAANLSASSIGIQPYKFVVVKDEEKRKALLEHSFGQMQVVDASHLLVIAIRTDINHEVFLDEYIDFMEAERALPKGTLNAYKEMAAGFIKMQDTPEKMNIWTAKQAYIALGTLLVACIEEGVDSVPMEGFIPEKYNEVLNLKEKNLSAVLVLPIGYGAEDDAYKSLKKVRRPLSYMVEEI